MNKYNICIPTGYTMDILELLLLKIIVVFFYNFFMSQCVHTSFVTKIQYNLILMSGSSFIYSVYKIKSTEQIQPTIMLEY